MSALDFSYNSKLSRRSVLAGTGAVLVVPRALAATPPVFKIGILPFGTVQWEIKTLLDQAFDKEAGIRVEAVPLASSEAARIAFLSGSVDAIANDLLFAARLKAEGNPILYMPHSSTEGALMVASASPIERLADLKGKSIGVAGGALDKSWLVLRAAATKEAGLDLLKDAKPVFGAPPLLAAKVESGELDSALLYWSQAARLQAQGYRQVVSVESLLADLGAKGKVSIVGYLFKADASRDLLIGFGKAIRATENILVDRPDAWKPVRSLMQAPDEATFDALKSAYIRGVPRKPRAEEIADARSFFSVILRLGGAALVGSATDLPDDLYVDQAIYG